MVSSLITGAVALLLILVGGYVVAGGILTIAESTMNTQVQMSGIQDNIRESSIHIDSTSVGYNGGWWLVLDLNNTGSTTYGGSDFSRMDLFVYQGVDTKTLARYTSTTGSPKFQSVILNDLVNRNMWDPSEILEIRINNTVIPNWTKIVTPNGIATSTNL